MTKHFLSITDLSSQEVWEVFSLAKKLKKEIQLGHNGHALQGKTLVSIFEKPSLRTKLSFEVAMTQLGGHAVYLGPYDIGMGKRESVTDVACVASSMADIIMARTYKHDTICQLAESAWVPVINGLSDLEHPCQALADIYTILEHFDRLQDIAIAYIGDGENNVAHSLCLGAALLGITFKCASPIGYSMKKEIVKKAQNITSHSTGKILQTTDPIEAVEGADVVYTDTWVSMGDEKEKEQRLKVFQSYQVTKKLMQLAKKEAIFMHDMPVYREQEVTSEVVDGPQSVIIKQAENRLHVQKALILHLIGKGGE